MNAITKKSHRNQIEIKQNSNRNVRNQTEIQNSQIDIKQDAYRNQLEIIQKYNRNQKETYESHRIHIEFKQSSCRRHADHIYGSHRLHVDFTYTSLTRQGPLFYGVFAQMKIRLSESTLEFVSRYFSFPVCQTEHVNFIARSWVILCWPDKQSCVHGPCCPVLNSQIY